MLSYKNYFKGKKITLMGLGLLGRGVGDAEFLAECGAKLTVTDLRDEKTLAPSIKKLKKLKTCRNINFVLGEHRLENFRDCDFVLKAAGVPLDSPFIAEARKHSIPIEMDASLFAKLSLRGVKIVGITGTRGKSTTTVLIYEILKKALGRKALGARKIFKGGNLVSGATLPLLLKVKSGDIVVLELDSWQLQGFGPTSRGLRGTSEAGISPHIAVVTNFLDDHLNYYRGDRKSYFSDKANIFKFQKKGDTLVVGEQALKQVRKARPLGQSKLLAARAADVPRHWKIKLLGEHNRANIACALAAARSLGVPDSVSRRAIENFKGVPGRLELVRTIRGVKIYNDNNATTPEATVTALRALSLLYSPLVKGVPDRAGDFKNPSPSRNSVLPFINPPKAAPFRKGGMGESKKIILICGGTDKGLPMSKLVAEIPQRCKAVVFLKETGTEKLLASSFQVPGKDFQKLEARTYKLKATEVYEVDTLKECVQKAIEIAKRGDIILFSPAFASFGRWFKNEYDRGNQFMHLVEELK